MGKANRRKFAKFLVKTRSNCRSIRKGAPEATIWFLGVVLYISLSFPTSSLGKHLLNPTTVGVNALLAERYLKTISFWQQIILLSPIILTFVIVLRNFEPHRKRKWLAPLLTSFLISSSLHIIIGGIINPNYSYPIIYISGLGVAATFWIVWKMPSRLMKPWINRLGVKDYLTLENSLRTTFLQIVGGIIVIAGFYFSWQSSYVANENLNLTLKQNEDIKFEKSVALLREESPEQRAVGFDTLTEMAISKPSQAPRVVNLFSNFILRWSTSRDSSTSDSGNVNQLRPDLAALITGIGKLQLAASRKGSEAEWIGIPPIDWTGLNFASSKINGLYLSSMRLASARFENAKLKGARFKGVDLANANFENVNIDAMFASYERALEESTGFYDCDLSGARFSNATVVGVSFLKSKLVGTDFTGADILGADFTDVNGLTVDQIKVAKNYDKAKLPPGFREQLGLATEMPVD